MKVVFEPLTTSLGRLEPILRPLRRGPKTAGTVLHDQVGLQKSLFLCVNCVNKMDRRHLKRLRYHELESFHGYGICDGCQHELSCALWLHESNPHNAWPSELERQAEVRRRERAFREKHENKRR